MVCGGLLLRVGVLELDGLLDELFERASFQIAHARSCWLLGCFDILEHEGLLMAHAFAEAV